MGLFVVCRLIALINKTREKLTIKCCLSRHIDVIFLIVLFTGPMGGHVSLVAEANSLRGGWLYKRLPEARRASKLSLFSNEAAYPRRRLSTPFQTSAHLPCRLYHDESTQRARGGVSHGAISPLVSRLASRLTVACSGDSRRV